MAEEESVLTGAGEFPLEAVGDAIERTVDGHRSLRLTNAMKRRMKDLLGLPAPESEGRDYLETLGVLPEKIDNCMLIVGVVFRQAAEGNLRAFQEIRSLIENDETDLERKIKRTNLEKNRAQIEDIRRKWCDGGDMEEDNAGILTGVLNESLASLWAEEKGGDDS